MSTQHKCILMIVLLILSFAASLLIGPIAMGPKDVMTALMGQGEMAHNIAVRDIRLPRSLLAIIIGAGLGASGAALQGFTRNDLAAPGILGFSACAALGAVTALYFGAAQIMPFAALIAAALGAALLLALIGTRKGASLLILAGVGVSALATAITGLVMNFAPNPWALSEMVYWLMGSLHLADMHDVILCAIMSMIGLTCLLACAFDLRTLSLGETSAISLGVNIRRVQWALIAGVSLCVGSGVAVAGAIGFIGLFVPHIMRFIFGADPARLIPLSAIGGAMALIWADMAAKLITHVGSQIYLGILTSLIGAPFFLWLAIKGVRHD